ncbi:MAG: hypothetical protein RJA92_1315 [Bacteroidota bacterium]|jgi:hypothetical protein
MEVHHHSHKPKNWKEYITEFIMLFAAVTLGFFAENLREHSIIEHRLEQNKIAILKDLENDAVTIDSILVTEQASLNTFDRFMNLLYLSKNKNINETQLIDSIKSFPDIIATTFTLYVNNSSFKNMQSSGLLSYVEEENLKNSLSYYYEVVFKRIESNNNFFDQVGTEFNGILPIGIGTYIRSIRSDSSKYDLNNRNKYLNFMLSLKETKNLLQSEKFIYDIQRYYNQIFVYQLALKLAKEENSKLIQLLKSEH